MRLRSPRIHLTDTRVRHEAGSKESREWEYIPPGGETRNDDQFYSLLGIRITDFPTTQLSLARAKSSGFHPRAHPRAVTTRGVRAEIN